MIANFPVWGRAKAKISDVFAENDWSTIIMACQTNSVPETWVVGDQKVMSIGGVDYLVDIIGKNHDTYVGGGLAPITFMLHELYATKAPIRSYAINQNGFAGTDMAVTTLPNIKAAFDPNIASAIKTITKMYNTNAANLSSYNCDLFIPSITELTGDRVYQSKQDGVQYEYFKTSANRRKANVNTPTALDTYWTRSAYFYNQTDFYIMTSAGGSTSTSAIFSGNICIGFCF